MDWKMILFIVLWWKLRKAQTERVFPNDDCYENAPFIWSPKILQFSNLHDFLFRGPNVFHRMGNSKIYASSQDQELKCDRWSV